MSLEVNVRCDICDAFGDVKRRHENVAGVRRRLRAAGWVYRFGKDLCTPACVDDARPHAGMQKPAPREGGAVEEK